MIQQTTADDTIDGYRIRAWSGVATDEGVGFICLVEITDATARVICSFEEFLPSRRHHPGAARLSETDAVASVQAQALSRARAAASSDTLSALHGHRFETA